ncbi:MAG: hypothetical protein ACFCBW_19320, partial [Candidatus Competibacterales bacterium]
MGFLEVLFVKPLALLVVNIATLVMGFFSTLVWFFLNPTRLATLIGSVFYTAFNRLSQERAIKQLIDQRKLPQDRWARNAKEHDANAASRAYRLRHYLQINREFQRQLAGPYALSLWLALGLDPAFQGWWRQFAAGQRRFDALEAEARRLVYRYDNALSDLRREPLARLDRLEDRSERLGYLIRATVRRMRTISLPPWREWWKVWRFWQRSSALPIFARLRRRFWRYWRQRSALGKDIKAERRALAAAERRLDRVFGPRLERCLRRLHRREDRDLMHRSHVFEADAASLQLTVESGRLCEFLTGAAARRRLRRLGLADLPFEPTERALWLRRQVQPHFPLGPFATAADDLEAFLRLRALAGGLEGVDPAWVATLPPPGILALRPRGPGRGGMAVEEGDGAGSALNPAAGGGAAGGTTAGAGAGSG